MKSLRKFHPAFILFGLIFIIFSPILFLGKLFPGFDLLLVFYPYSFHLLNYHSVWVSGVLSGFNIGATPSGFAGNWAYYFLANLIGSGLFNFITFYNVVILFYFLLTAIFSYLASRKLGFDNLVSVLITSVYIFSAYNLSWIVNIVAAPSLFIFPAVIYFLIKFRNSRNWLPPVLGGMALGFGLVVSHPQFALVAIFGGFLFSIFLIFSAKGESASGEAPLQWKFLIVFLVMCVIGATVSAFQLMPEYQTSQIAQRGLALSFSESQECALGLADFVRYFLPNFSFGVNCESLLYVGTLPLILAVIAIVYLRKNRQVLFWSLLLVFVLLFSMKYSPLAWIFHQLPIWQSVRGPGRLLMLGNFALAVLAGYGFNWILENKENFKEFKFFKWIKNIFFGFLLIVIAINALSLFKYILIKFAENYFDKYYYYKTIGLPVEHYHRSIENLISGNFYTFSFLNKDFLIPFILAAAAFLTLVFIRKLNKISLFYLFLLSGFIWTISSPMVSSGLNRSFFDKTDIVKFLEKQKQPFRIYSLMPSLSTYQLLVLAHDGVTEADENEFLKTMLPPNLNLAYNIGSIDGYENAMPRRTARILAELLSERATLGNKIAEARLKPEEKIKIFENHANLLSMMNVKYIISAFPLDGENFRRVFETKATRFGVPIYVYENENILPRFYFAKSTNPIESDEEAALKTVLAPDINFNDLSFIECGNDCGGVSSGKIINYDYKNGYLQLNTESKADSWLIFSESYDRGWQSKINGKKAPIIPANYVYQAVRVPAGKNVVEFGYKP